MTRMTIFNRTKTINPSDIWVPREGISIDLPLRLPAGSLSPQMVISGFKSQLAKNERDLKQNRKTILLGLFVGVGATLVAVVTRNDLMGKLPLYMNPMVLSAVAGFVGAGTLALLNRGIGKESGRIKGELLKRESEKPVRPTPVDRGSNQSAILELRAER